MECVFAAVMFFAYCVGVLQRFLKSYSFAAGTVDVSVACHSQKERSDELNADLAKATQATSDEKLSGFA